MKTLKFLGMLLIALSFAAYAEDELKTTAKTLAGCDDKVLGTTAGMQSCFTALDKAQGELGSIQKKLTAAQAEQRSLQETVDALKPLSDRNNARLTEDISTKPRLASTKAETENIQEQLKVMRKELNSEELRKITERMKALKMSEDFNELTLSNLNDLYADKAVQKALGCGFLIDDKRCTVWKEAKRQIHESHRAISATVTSALDAVEADAALKLTAVKGLEAQAAALTPFAKPGAKNDKSKEFFDKLQKLGMLGKLAFMEASQLESDYKLQKAQIDLLKEKIKSSILGSVIKEEVEELKVTLTRELMDEITALKDEILTEVSPLKEDIEQLKLKACGLEGASTMCVSASVDSSNIPKAPQTNGTGGGGSTNSGDGRSKAD